MCPKLMADSKPVVKVGVRTVVEFLGRSGDIDDRVSGRNMANEGTRLHGIVQRRRKAEAAATGASFNAEVALSADVERENVILRLHGRADGVWISEDDIVTVEEIKSTFVPVDEKREPSDDFWHFAQAKCYAYMYAVKHGRENMSVRLIYVHFKTERTVDFVRTYTFGELEAFFSRLTEEYAWWVEFDMARKAARDKAIDASVFPFPSFRKGQRELAVFAYRAVERNKKLFAEAPTGIGKTISVLFPVVKALCGGKTDKFFYLTAKTITRGVAEAALERMDAQLLTITLTAKEQLCAYGGECNPDGCPFAEGHFDRVNEAVKDAIQTHHVMKRDDVIASSLKHNVCPHELQLDITNHVDGIIGDYNHVFDPKVRLQRFFGEQATVAGRFAVLIDEAHNMPDRAREMFSTQFDRNVLKNAKKDITYKPLRRAMSACVTEISNMIRDAKESNVRITAQKPKRLGSLVALLSDRLDAFLEENSVNSDIFWDCYFAVKDFERTFDYFEKDFATGVDDCSVKLVCLDPRRLLMEAMKPLFGVVFFSATLTPLEYFQNVLGGVDDDYAVRLSSPFEDENLLVVVDDRVSTRYADREDSYEHIADTLFCMTEGRRGKYFAFFPSYAYLTAVFDIFSEKYPDSHTIVQTRQFGPREREAFLNRFEEDGAFVAFAVMGGVFSEGIDLVGSRLIGAAIIGVGIPQIGEERNFLSEYYKKMFGVGRGFDYAYVYPGMNKCMQAAGRVIRTEDDHGVLLLIDDRFSSYKYVQMFPSNWRSFRSLRAGASELSVILSNFWNK